MDTTATKYTVLAIDDEPLLLKTYTRILRTEFHVITATKVSDGIALLEAAENIDVILIDNEMPEIKGIEAIPIIREMDRFRKTPILVVTASDSELLQRDALNLGASDYIVKPMSPAILRLRVKLHSDNARLRKQLEELAFADSLTGLNNRRGMLTHLQREIRRCRRSNLNLSLALIDVDHFKKINDTYGHAVGDQALRLIASTMQSYFQRATDVLARYGGEEFVIASIELDAEEMNQRVAEFRNAVKELRIVSNDVLIDHQITVSAGGITLVPTDDDIALIDHILDRADECLYKAKISRDDQQWSSM